MKREILDLKNQPSVTCYIEMLQNNISRMSNHSGIIKASMCVIYTIVITIILDMQDLNKYWWITISISIFMAILDSYYLALEKAYRDKYDMFIDKLNSNSIDPQEIYDMKPRTTSLKCEILARMFYSFKSISIFGFYGIFIILSIIIHFI